MTTVMTMSVGRKRTLTAAELKAKCLSLKDDVPETLVGFWRDEVESVGDVVSPAAPLWNAEASLILLDTLMKRS